MSPTYLPTYYYFPTRAPGTTDTKKQANLLPRRYRSYILSAKYKLTKKISAAVMVTGVTGGKL